MNKELKTKIETAKELGKSAFHAGIKSAPMHDKRVLDLLTGMPVGTGATKILKAWANAWHTENLKGFAV